MPTYSYVCTQCDHKFDAVQAFSDDALTECPNCGGKLRKLFNSVGVVFKGSGFYRTDSRAGKNGSSSTSPSGSSGSGSGSSSGSESSAPKKSSDSSSSSGSSSSGSSSSGSGASGGSSTSSAAAS